MHSALTRAYTLVELFLTLAVLMVVLGMMINLSTRVRRESADRVTRQMLAELQGRMAQYRRDNDGQLPPVTAIIGPIQVPNEADLQVAARLNNADFFRCLRLGELANRRTTGDDPLANAVRQANASTTGASVPLLEDPWGTPIVFMPGQSPLIGMAPGNVFFFVSAGPDRQFLTHDDNLYSYDETVLK